MATVRRRNPVFAAIATLFAFAVMAWFYLGGGLNALAGHEVGQISDQVAADAVKQYGIAQRQGTPMDICVQAGLVSAAYLQAKDEPNYTAAKAREKVDCAAAGVPQM